MASIRKLASGRWQAQIRKQGFPQQTRAFASKQSAQQWARLIESEMDRRLFIAPTQFETSTLRELADRYETEVLRTKRDFKPARSRLKTLKARLGAYTAATLTPTVVAQFRDARLMEVGPQAVRHELSMLSRVLNVAAREWGVPLRLGNPVRQVFMPKLPRGRDRRIEPHELEKLADALQCSPAMGSLILFAIETGLRRGELKRMVWNNIDLDRRIMTIPESKNGHPRTVPLSTQAVAILARMGQGSGEAHVFWLKADSMSQSFRRACRRAGINDLRLHDLRHEATSRLFEKGLSVMEVATVTGHKTLQMLKRYTHLKAADLVAKLE